MTYNVVLDSQEIAQMFSVMATLDESQVRGDNYLLKYVIRKAKECQAYQRDTGDLTVSFITIAQDF